MKGRILRPGLTATRNSLITMKTTMPTTMVTLRETLKDRIAHQAEVIIRAYTPIGPSGTNTALDPRGVLGGKTTLTRVGGTLAASTHGEGVVDGDTILIQVTQPALSEPGLRSPGGYMYVDVVRFGRPAIYPKTAHALFGATFGPRTSAGPYTPEFDYVTEASRLIEYEMQGEAERIVDDYAVNLVKMLR